MIFVLLANMRFYRRNCLFKLPISHQRMIHTTLLLRMMVSSFLLGTTTCNNPVAQSQNTKQPVADSPAVKQTANALVLGADRTAKYIPMLKGKRIGMVINQTSVMGPQHRLTVDSLLKLKLDIKKIFGPEHGFRGNASNGATVNDVNDKATGLPVISLYGKHYKPTAADLSGLDVLIFDIQDVGTRFYTYISTLHYVMEACAENNVELIVFDRPNPNGYLIDGPILDSAYRSFVGMHPIPIAHGMTIGEYALMINGEHWLKNGVTCKLNIVKMEGYDHTMPYTLPINPSPNLNTAQSILLYPSVCLFEGTNLSLGRGTDKPFLLIGHPALKGKFSFSFTPKSIPGVSENPPQKNNTCYGIDLSGYDTNLLRESKQINLDWLIDMYKAFPDKKAFFNAYFVKLVGTAQLQKQIEAGNTADQIRDTWKSGLSKFKLTRTKYLLYE